GGGDPGRREGREGGGAVGGGHAGEETSQSPVGIGHGEVAGVEIASRAFQRELEFEHAARPEGDGGAPTTVLGAVGDEHEICGEQIAVRLGEGAELRAADLLLAVEEELDVDL